ncbi:hypothetical protein OnM2_055041 [Erysiphe neolycopersici]|uniref:Uncharacterized protein n=1 Tax=Erysiphe neolycopersici TaxID=212602 RepID=A0A420HRH9_9PEZI|nr:hypothetical protein OnM2_055041 [Erysiphe neolycopersici]
MVYEELSDLIHPSYKTKIITPNFSLEVKDPDGFPAMAETRALYGDARGERDQLALRL